MSPYAQSRLAELGRRTKRAKLADFHGRRWRLTTYGDINALLRLWGKSSEPPHIS